MKSSILIASLAVGLTIPTTGINAQESTEEPIIKAKFTVYSLKRPQGLKFIHGDRKGASALGFFSSGIKAQRIRRTKPNLLPRDTCAYGRKSRDQWDKGWRCRLRRGEFYSFNKTTGENGHRIYPLDDSKSELQTDRFGSLTRPLFNLKAL